MKHGVEEKTCPHCDAPLQGLGTFCWTCERPVRKPKGPASTDECDRPAPQYAAFTLPWEVMVSTNKRHGGMAGWSTKEYREKRDAMAMLLARDYSAAAYTRPVAVSLRLFPPNRRSDAHNFCKVIYDALEKAEVVDNDRSIEQWSGVVVSIDKDEPRCEVEVRRAA